MAKKKKHVFKLAKSGRKAKKQREVAHLLEVGTLESMRAAKQRTQDLLDYHWWYYSELAVQRNQKIEEIKGALFEACISDFKFDNWQRAVKYKYSLHPLSTVGSLSFIGGRFNAGADVNVNVPSHPALYVAVDKDTALQETLGQQDGQHSALTPLEIALTNAQSQSIVSVSGQLDKIFDLRSPKHLRSLMMILKHFELSDGLIKRADELMIDRPNIVQTGKQLIETVLNKNWRDQATNLEVPSNSQVFGHLLFIAGIDGVIYPSKFTGKDCLALFPQNFEGGGSFIKLDSEAPHKKVPNLIDGSNWRLCDVNFDDISGEGSTLQ